MTSEGIKISLIKKSGPGELIGITELIVEQNDNVTFEGLQFSDPGSYVVTVKSDRPDLIEDSEFTITIDPPSDIISQDKPIETDSTKSDTSGERPCIAQIDQPTYVLPPMRLEKPGGEQPTYEVASVIGINPFFYYNGIQMDTNTIRQLNLYNDSLFPRVVIEFRDEKEVLKKYPPLDDTRFEVFLNSQSSNIKSIHLRFKYESHKQLPRGYYSIVGTIDIPLIYTISSKSYTGTSFEALRNLSKEMNLGFNSNIQNTNDSMKWINTNKKVKDFISDIIQHSFIGEDSFMIGYIDFYYCFNFVDIEKEWKRDTSGDKAINSNPADRILAGKPETERVEPLVLTNDKGAQKTSNFIEQFSFTNNSTYQSIRKGYFTNVKYYDAKSKSFLEFKVDSLTSDGKETIIMKGQPGDSTYFEENYTNNYTGKIDDDNVHQNYNYASVQNRVNLDNLVKITCDLVLPNPNYNLYRFQKVKIVFTNDARSAISNETFVQRYSGEWQIIEISFEWKAGKMLQRIKATRKELSKTEEEKNEQQQAAKPETRESPSPNPLPPNEESPRPNSELNFGDIYVVQDASGNQYEITITDILGNGVDVVGNLRTI
jgi:hypothetical protein